MKRHICHAIIIGMLPFGAIGESMKLVHSVTGFVVVEFSQEGKPAFNDRFLKAEMEEQGILIPPSMRTQFNNQEVVYLDDPLFSKAFVEVYFPLCIADPAYEWQR